MPNYNMNNFLELLGNTEMSGLRGVIDGGSLDVNSSITVNSHSVTTTTVLNFCVISGLWQHVELLLERGAEIDATDNNGMTALHMAVIGGDANILNRLLERGAEIDATDNNGMTALHMAVKSRNLDVLTALLEGGASIDSIDNNGMTALHMAVGFRDLDALTALLERGADVAIINNGPTIFNGLNAIELAILIPSTPPAMIDLLRRAIGEIQSVEEEQICIEVSDSDGSDQDDISVTGSVDESISDLG